MALPIRITAGDSVTWEEAGVGGDAGWTYTYYFVGPSKKTVSASLVGGVLNASITAQDSAALNPGQYRWVLTRTDGTERVTEGKGYTYVDPDFSQEGTTDNRTHAEIMLDAIEAKLEGRITLDQERYQINGREWDRIPIAELQALRRQYRWEVYKEQVRRGLRKPRKRIRYKLK